MCIFKVKIAALGPLEKVFLQLRNGNNNFMETNKKCVLYFFNIKATL
jgi:hypothetical protein